MPGDQLWSLSEKELVVWAALSGRRKDATRVRLAQGLLHPSSHGCHGRPLPR